MVLAQEAVKLPVKVVKAATEQQAKASEPKTIVVTPTVAGTTMPDYGKGGFIVEKQRNGDTVIWPTHPATTCIDYGKPAYVVEKTPRGDTTISATIPGTSIKSFKEPSYLIEGKDK